MMSFSDLITDTKVVAYLDGLILPSRTEEEGLLKLEKVFQTAQKFGLEFNWEKCNIFKQEIEYLGYIICDNEVRPS